MQINWSAYLMAGVMLSCTGVAHAQDVAPPNRCAVLDGDIIGTATKRGESVQKVGIIISALSGEQLDALGVKDSSGLSLYTPGLQLQTAGGEGNTSEFQTGAAHQL